MTKAKGRAKGRGKGSLKGSAQRQPRGLTASTLLEIQADGQHRVGVRMELQKLGSEEDEQQLSLFEMLDADASIRDSLQKPEVAGLDLTVLEDRAVTALQKLLHATDYKGHQPVEARASTDWKMAVRRPVLQFSWPEYYEAFGLKRRANGRYSGKEEANARAALLSLERPFFITFKRRRWEGEGSAKREKVDRIETVRPLVSVTKGFKGLELEEDAALDTQDTDKERARRATHLLVEVSPLLSEGIEDFYVMKPNRLHEEIKLALGSKRNVSPSVHLFISWLLTKNMVRVRASKRTLAERLRLGSYVRQRKWKKVEEQLLECFQVATELGFLDSWDEVTPDVVAFSLNAERCSRVREKAGHEELKDIEDTET